MKSLGAMIAQLDGLLGTDDLNAWETRFVADISSQTDIGSRTTSLSGKQVEVIERIYRKHFGDAEPA